MQPIWANLAALAVAVLFYVWRSYHQTRVLRRRVLRQRVAYMLWVAAESVERPNDTLLDIVTVQ